MLLTLFAILTGSLIGLIRGGRRSGVTEAELRAAPLLVVAISTILVQAILNPVFPFLWSLIGTVALIAFAAVNRHLTGITVLMIGAALNLLPLLLNFATPVSDLALLSVGDLDAFGFPDIDGARESSTTATRLKFLGDAIPVPIFGSVVSIGDLILLVGLGDVFTNLFVSARDPERSLFGVPISSPAHAAPSSTKPAASTSAKTEEKAEEKVAILSPLQTSERGPNHRAPRRKGAPQSHVPAHAGDSADSDATTAHAAAPTSHVPAHAAEPVAVEHRDEPIVIDLDKPSKPAHGFDNSAALSTAAMNAIPVTPSASPATHPPAVEDVPELIDLTDPNDPRPIIDLTKSPSDAQMAEFLRRRRSADRDHGRVTVRPAGQRRGRAPAKISPEHAVEVAETTR